MDRDRLTLAVLTMRRILARLNQVHIRLKIGRFRNVAINNRNLIGIDPALGVLVVADPRGADALRIDLAVSIFPPFLKEETHFGAVDSRDILDTAEASHFHALAALRTLLELIVIYDTFRAFRERNSHHEFCLGILGIAHRLDDFAEEDGACRKNGYIDKSQHLDPFDA